MAFAEDLDVFFNGDEFAVDAVIGAVTVKVIFDSPTEQILGGDVLSNEYAIMGKASDLASLARNASLTVDGVAYKVRENYLVDDGKVRRVTLTKT